MNNIKVNLGKKVFEKEEQLKELTQDNISLSNRLRDVLQKMNELSEKNKNLKK